jgi:hypothetical protein
MMLLVSMKIFQNSKSVIMEEYAFDGSSRAGIILNDIEIKNYYEVKKMQDYPIYKIKLKNNILSSEFDEEELMGKIRDITKKNSIQESVFTARVSEISDIFRMRSAKWSKITVKGP